MRARLRLLALAILVARPATAGFTERVSVGVGGAQNGGGAFAAGVSSDGALVAFETFGFPTNLPGGPNGTFIRDRFAGTTTFLTTYQMEAFTPDFSTAAFVVNAALVPGDTNGVDDVYVFDVMTSAVERVSVASDASQGNHPSDRPSLSADGRLVAFRSAADNLVSSDTNAADDIFVHDRMTGVTERVSVAFDGSQANALSQLPTISGDGRFVVFESFATNLVPGGTDGQRYVFIHDRMTGATELASILPGGSPGSDTCNICISRPGLSDDGSIVAFDALDQVYVRDRVAATTELASRTSGGMSGNGGADRPAISADGRIVAFESSASDLIAGDTNGATDVFVRDRSLGTIERADVTTAGSETHGAFSPLVSADGRVAGFTSDASDLVPGDTNGFWDAFVRDRTCGNGVFEGAEECDDGRNDDGDGCDANCTTTRCGNGRPTSGEACDDGSTNGTDQCCTSGCQLVDGDGDGVCDAFDPCTGAAIEGERLLLTGFSGQFMRTPRLSLKGHVTLAAPFNPPLDPLANGVRLLITDALALPLLDVTIPGGPPAGSPAKGWTVNSSHTKWRYKDTNPARFPDAITDIQVQDQSASAPGRVRFTIKGELSLVAFRGARLPIETFLFLHPPDDSMGECGDVRPACVVTSLGDRLSCR